ncbi:hypothetical protein KAI56_05085 [Candidatus Parcubacteria bacterium]|nr:hypothetical protein [Candidatus Parcubacteria bacterium]
MIKEYKYLSQLPHGDDFLSVPISGLFTELSDKSKIFDSCKKPFDITIEPKHLKAGSRIADCTGYLATISHRLINDSSDELFMSKHLDWESLINYSQIMLDSFSILTPLFYGLQEKYHRKNGKTDMAYPVNSFNNLKEWFEHYSLDDELTKNIY